MEKENTKKLLSLQNLSKDEQVSLLKEMFREVGVVSTWKWDDAYRNVKNDERFKFVKMSMQEKKQVFADFMIQIR